MAKVVDLDNLFGIPYLKYGPDMAQEENVYIKIWRYLFNAGSVTSYRNSKKHMPISRRYAMRGWCTIGPLTISLIWFYLIIVLPAGFQAWLSNVGDLIQFAPFWTLLLNLLIPTMILILVAIGIPALIMEGQDTNSAAFHLIAASTILFLGTGVVIYFSIYLCVLLISTVP